MLSYVVLKLEVSKSVGGGDFFPIIFRLVKLIFNISTFKTYLQSTVSKKLISICNILTCKTNFCKESFSDKKHVLSLVWLRAKISRKKLF